MKSFWQEAFAQAVGGLIIAGLGGVGYLCWSVPRQLDQVLQNQQRMADRFVMVEARLGKAEESISGLQTRVVRLEDR